MSVSINAHIRYRNELIFHGTSRNWQRKMQYSSKQEMFACNRDKNRDNDDASIMYMLKIKKRMRF